MKEQSMDMRTVKYLGIFLCALEADIMAGKCFVYIPVGPEPVFITRLGLIVATMLIVQFLLVLAMMGTSNGKD